MSTIASRITEVLPSSRAILSLPVCAGHGCMRPPTLWQRWWARHEGIRFEQDWYCSPECFATGLAPRVSALAAGMLRVRPTQPRFPLGLLLMEQGIISPEQLQRALSCQRRKGHGRIGEWLVATGAARESDITSALALQQNCPLFSNAAIQSFPSSMQFPASLTRRYGGVPVYFDSLAGTLYLGFASPLNRPLLRAAGHLMGCRIEPCIVSDELHRLAAERWESGLRGEAVCIDQRQSIEEMTRAIAGYAAQANASSCALARCEGYLWTRLYGDLRSLDLLFRADVEDDLGSTAGELSAVPLD